MTEIMKTNEVALTGVDLRTALEGKTHAEKLQVLKQITSYVGATCERIDNYLGQKLILRGLVIQKATVRMQEPIVDAATGEVQEFTEQDRVIMKVQAADGKIHWISFVSLAVANFCRSFLVPLWGMGDYPEPVPIMIRQTTTSRGRTYNLQVIE